MILVELLEEFQLRQVKRFREAVSLSKAAYIKINTNEPSLIKDFNSPFTISSTFNKPVQPQENFLHWKLRSVIQKVLKTTQI